MPPDNLPSVRVLAALARLDHGDIAAHSGYRTRAVDAHVGEGVLHVDEGGAELGELVACFDGVHGWFWRNRTDQPVAITLETGGAYLVLEEMK